MFLYRRPLLQTNLASLGIRAINPPARNAAAQSKCNRCRWRIPASTGTWIRSSTYSIVPATTSRETLVNNLLSVMVMKALPRHKTARAIARAAWSAFYIFTHAFEQGLRNDRTKSKVRL